MGDIVMYFAFCIQYLHGLSYRINLNVLPEIIQGNPLICFSTDSLYNRIISKCTVKNLIFMNNNGILLNKTMGELFRETVYINWGKRDKEKVISIFCPFLSILIPFRYSWKKWSRAKHMQKWKVGAGQKVIIQ